MKNFLYKRGCLLMLPIMSLALSGFSQTLSCSDIKNGVFIFFSKKDGSRSTYTRSGDVQKEFDASTHETVLWDVEWESDCSYYLKYNSGLEGKSKQEMEMLKKHKVLFKITSVTEDYYTFESYLDKSSNPINFKDTLWIKQRKDQKNKLISNPRVDSLLAIRKLSFDSSLRNTAILYIFRPGKFAESGADCTIYCNDTAICTMTDQAAYVVRILKEGPMTFVARVRKQEMPLTIDVKYGKKYFLRCEIKWAIPPKPIFTISNLEEARPYFGNIKIER